MRFRTFSILLGWLALFASNGALSQSHSHGAAGHAHDKALVLPAGPSAPSVSASIAKDPVGGWNLHVTATNFRFAPEHASGEHVAGEGHGHIYVNGKKIARLYGAWFHIGSLPTGGADIRVTLNANDHREIMVGGKAVEARLTVPGS